METCESPFSFCCVTLLKAVFTLSENLSREEKKMEKALTKVTSFKVGGSWISKKAKEELSNITTDLTVSALLYESWIFSCFFIFLSGGFACIRETDGFCVTFGCTVLRLVKKGFYCSKFCPGQCYKTVEEIRIIDLRRSD